jgi:hypothetical protein
MTQLPGSDLVDLTRDVPPTPPVRLLPPLTAAVAVDSDRLLFGAANSPRWRMAGRGGFVVVDGRLESVPGADLGLLWCTEPTPADFVLRLDWLRWRHVDASGVFVRFPEPAAPSEANPACVAMQRGFEVQIDAVGIPGASPIHRTAAIFNQPVRRHYPRRARPPGEWNALEIRVRGQHYEIALNGTTVAAVDNSDPARGLPGTAEAPSYVGLQVYPGLRVAFRDIRIRAL